MDNELLQKIILEFQTGNNVLLTPVGHGLEYRWKQWQTERQTIADLIKIGRAYPTYKNLAVLTGFNNELVLDFDHKEDFAEFEAKYPQMTDTYTVKSHDGYHLHYKLASDYITLTHPLCEVWYTGHFAQLPGSVHSSGTVYTLVNDAPKMSIKLGDLLNCGCSTLVNLPEGKEKKSFLDTSKQTNFSSSLPGGECPQNYPLFYGAYQFIKDHYNVCNFLNLSSEFEKVGGYYWTLCTCHNDTKPSLQVNLKDGRVSCYSPKCILYSEDHRGLDIVDVYAKMYCGSNTKRAAQILLYSLEHLNNGKA